jgi:hypothetical protein
MPTQSRSLVGLLKLTSTPLFVDLSYRVVIYRSRYIKPAVDSPIPMLDAVIRDKD